MAFITPQHEYDLLRRAIEEQYPPDEREEVFKILEPFAANGSRLPLCILKLAKGRKKDISYLAECARKDYRDVIFWAENPEEAALDTPEKIEAFQNLLQWAEATRDPELDALAQRLGDAERLDPKQ